MSTIVRGQTVNIKSTVYLDQDNNLLADLTGAELKGILKADPRESDLNALAVITGSIYLPGMAVFNIQAVQTNNINQNIVYFESIVKLANGSVIRSGITSLTITGNVLKLPL
jgi:hypothetical protein